jgi:ABC-type transport system substrate-binding protein
MSSKHGSRRYNRRDFLRLVGIAGTGLGLAACTPRIVEVEKLVTSTPVAFKKGGKLTIGLNGETKTLDPHASNLWIWNNMRKQIFEQLLRVDSQGLFHPYLATDYKWVDNKTLEFTLNTDVIFHNGQKFSAEDVKYTIDRISNPDFPSEWPPLFTGLDMVEVLTPDKVRFSLKEPDATFPDLVSEIDILSESIHEDEIATTPIGTGAFKFEEWLPNERIRLVRFDKYHEPEQPYLDELIYKPMPDSEARIASLIAGDIDVNFDVALKDIAHLATTPGIKVEKLQGGPLWLMYLNMCKPPFNDKRIRQALLYGFDRQQYNRNFLNGLSRVTNSPIDPSNWAYNPEVEKMYPYDPEKAKSLLAEAGYNGGNTLEVEIIYPVGLEEYKTVSEFFQSQMNEIGVNVKVVGMELAAWSNKIIKEKTYDIAFDFRDIEVTEPAVPYNDFTFTKPDAENFDGFTENMIPGYLDAIKQGLQETDQAKRKEIYMKLQQQWVEELPGWILIASPSYLVTRDWVKNYTWWGAQPFRMYKTWVDK